MSGRRKKTDTAPEWFNLDKYDKQASLDMRGWLIQFGVRRELFAILEGRYDHYAEKLRNQILTVLLGWIHDDPILQWGQLLAEFGPAIVRIFPGLTPLHSGQPRNQMAVHPTTVDELYRAQICLNPDLRRYFTQFYDQMKQGIEAEENTPDYLQELAQRLENREMYAYLEPSGEEEKLPYAEVLNHPHYCSSDLIPNQFLFSINIALPDKLLQAQLLESVKRVRRYFSKIADISKQLPTNPAEDWIDEQLLAYLDLQLEKRVPHGVRLTNAETIELIWPSDRPGKGGEKSWGLDHLNGTTAPLATEMMADYSEAFWTLQARVAEELAIPSLDRAPHSSLAAGTTKPETRRSMNRKRKEMRK